MTLPLSNVSPISSSNSGATITPPNGSQILASRVSNLPKGFSTSILGTSSSPLAVKVKAHTPTSTSTRLFAQTEHWVKRNSLFELLEEALLPKPSGEKPLIVRVLHGAGGMGKSELAVKFTHQYCDKFSLAWCLDYSATGNLKDQYLELATELALPVIQEESFEKLRDRVHRKLENRPGAPWLLILDNVEKPIHPNELPTKGGSILMTAQDNGVWDGGSIIPVDTFSLEEAVALIQQITGEKESDEVKQLAEEWGLLPFAIHQVARYIKTRKMSITNYRTLYPDPLQGATSKQQKYQKAFQTVWTPALEKLQEESPFAMEWLELSAYLAPKAIPEVLIGAWLKEKEGVNSEQQLPEIRFHLEKFALATFSPETKTYDMHQLVQGVLRAREGGEARLNVLFNLFDKAWEFNRSRPNTWNKLKAYVPHIRSLTEHAGMGQKSAYWLIEASDYIRMVDGDYQGAVVLSTKAKELLDAIDFPKDSIDYLRALVTVGLSYHELGRLDEALKFYDEANDRLPSLPQRDRPAAFIALLQNMGEFYHDIGSLEKAVSMHTFSVALSRESHSDVHLANSLRNLGNCLIEQGKMEPAKRCYTEALVIAVIMDASERELLLPKLHMGMAGIYVREGNKKKLVAAAEEAIRIGKRVFNPDHPEVAMLKKTYADFLLGIGDLENASIQLSEAETVLSQAFGPDSPKLNELLITKGGILRMRENYQEAIEMFIAALNHPSTHYFEKIILYQNLASIEVDLARSSHSKEHHLEKAKHYFELACQQLPKEENSLYMIVNPLIDLGYTWVKLGQPEKGIPHLERALQILKSVDPEEDHEAFCRIFKFLGEAFFYAQQFQQSAENYEKVAEIIKSDTSDDNLIDLVNVYLWLGSAHFESRVAEAKTRAADAWKKGLAAADRITEADLRGKQRSRIVRRLLQQIGTPLRELAYPFHIN